MTNNNNNNNVGRSLSAKMKRYIRQHYLAVLFQRLARMKGCTECGTHEHVQYVWHHPWAKNFNIGHACHHRWSDVKAELALTVPMCSSCHTKHHKLGNITSKETKARISASLMGNTNGRRVCTA